MRTPTLYVVAGPNGSGKSTLSRSGRFRGLRIVDPDEMARGISAGNAARQAGRMAVRERRAAIAAGETVVVESTLAGRSVIRLMDRARIADYRIELHYVSLESVECCLDRVSNRVILGGHDVPCEDVKRRFFRSRANLSAAVARSDEVVIYDNGDPGDPFRPVVVLTRGLSIVAENLPDWVADLALDLR